MTSQTVIATDQKSAYLKRWIRNRIIVVEFPLDVAIVTIEEYFNVDDDEFYALRARKPKHLFADTSEASVSKLKWVE